MRSALKTLKGELKALKIELRIFSKPPNNSPEVAEDIKKEIIEHSKAISILEKHHD